jgi:hypothetical protein
MMKENAREVSEVAKNSLEREESERAGKRRKFVYQCRVAVDLEAALARP